MGVNRSLMPKGVEHLAVDAATLVADGESFVDAERR